ncbi:M1 family metallopeptidase [Actinomadura hibisca]|uniref:M1 family metallopeptidase n=1 Tax=Actinomadura hibisca TaxID=68565 RepID=UPI00082A0465|nr:M1 family metallopeptidase [Actinomadura hibisca]
MITLRARRTAAALLLPALAGASGVAATAAERPLPTGPANTAPAFTPGADGAGDPYFPKAGNGGYDARKYDISLRYLPGGPHIESRAAITAAATQNLSRFNLDLVGLNVESVTVDGKAAAFRRDGQELIVTPANGIAKGATFTVTVRYSGTPGTLDDPGLGRTGWINTSDGADTLSQPLGSATWYPLNDHPSDKAAHSFTIEVPKGLHAIANGEPGRTTSTADGTVFRWKSGEPMASYLALLAIGKFTVRDTRTPHGTRMITAVDPTSPQDPAWLPRTTGEVTDGLARMFGPFPFASTGGVIDDVAVGYALETQNRPTYPSGADTSLVVHELAHQWFGDSVSLRRWQDIWLNEGFATYAEWLWAERTGGSSTAQRFAAAYQRAADNKGWQRPTGAPGRKGLFDSFAIYTRGAMTLHALRTTVGDPAFFKILKTWAAAHRHRNATTADFVAHAEKVSGKRLDGLFQTWLFTPGKPVWPPKPS